MTSLKGCVDKYFVEMVCNETFDDRRVQNGSLADA